MKTHRTLAASPIQSASHAWQKLKEFVVNTLESSARIPLGSVHTELNPLDRLGPALVAGGHLENKGLVLCGNDLHVTMTTLTADAALDAPQDIEPMPNGIEVGNEWTLYVPLPGALDAHVENAVSQSDHLSVATPPKNAPSKNSRKSKERSTVDLDALRKTEEGW